MRGSEKVRWVKAEVINQDCLEAMRDIPDGSIDAVICDPPYGTTACSWDSVIPFAPMWAALKRVVKRNGAIVLFGSQPFTSALVMSNPQMFRYALVWQKTRCSNPFLADSAPLRKHEDLLVFAKDTPAYFPQKELGLPYFVSSKSGGRVASDDQTNMAGFVGYISDGRFPSSVLTFSNPSLEVGLHPTQKPIELLRYLVRTYTQEGDTILDFAAGSGTLGVAAVIEHRNSICIDSDAHYCEVARARISRARGIACDIPKRVRVEKELPLFQVA